MQAIYAFGILILIAFLGRPFVYRGKRRLSSLGFFFFSGLAYVFLGVYLGKTGINVLDQQVLKGFTPLITLGLGWVGFIYGFQIEYRYLAKFPRKYIGLSFLLFLFVSGFSFLVLVLILKQVFRGSPSYLLYGMSAGFGLLLSINSPSLLNALSSSIQNRGRYYYLARFLVSVGGFWGIAGLALLYSFWHFPFFQDHVFLKGAIILLVSTTVPVLLGFLFHLLTVKAIPEQELLVYLLGFVFFVSGAAFYFNLFPLYVCMVLGIAFSNLTKVQEKIYPLLFSTEKPLYIVLLILVGALWEVNLDYRTMVLVGLLLCLRLISYALPLPFLGSLLGFPFRFPFVFGTCFMSAGGLGIAFAVGLKLSYPLPLTDVFFSSALLTILISELIGFKAIKISFLNLDKLPQEK